MTKMSRDDLHALGYEEDVEAQQRFGLRLILCTVSFIFIAIPTVILINRWVAGWLALIAFLASGTAFVCGITRPSRSRHTGKQMRVERYHGEEGSGHLYICDDSRTYFIAWND